MSFDFSTFGRQLGQGSGIGELMDDLGHAMATGGTDLKMLGGGQPARIPQVNAVWRRRLEELAEEHGGLDRAMTCYDPPQGNPAFIRAIAKLFRETFGWELGPENIAITTGGQTAFFLLLNALAGARPDGTRKKILLPIVPEYIGYADQGIDGSIFKAITPSIEEIGPHDFKYRVDFDKLEITPDVAAILASRPTNPTGNVLTDNEVAKLSAIAKDHGIPLILDNAYGAPFPGIIFTDATPFWEPHVILTYSLSKIGLPGTRTGIVIGPPEIIRAIGSMSAIVGLSNPSTGQQIMRPLIESGEILSLSREVIMPYYREKCRIARACAHEFFGDDIPWRIHVSEGSLFLWLWFPGLPVSTRELYQILKKRNVLIIPGEYFFFGLDDTPDWPHRRECIRVSYAMNEDTVRDGLRIIAGEVKKLSRHASADCRSSEAAC
ncbi:MAG: valine--pyruvate transaminase [Verrucomicrobiota bacterium JB025]|nr:valine--pyruvate transaminase [Verrucomicrobiota bacterium JB025]